MTSTIVVQILCVLWVTTMVPGQKYTTECDKETMTTKAGHREHPNNCSKYIQCLLNKDGQFVGITRDCGVGTYWSPTFLTCMSATKTVCKHDLCYQQPDGKRRKMQGNCRGFHECQKSLSIQRCCSLGQYFHDSLVCVHNMADITCKDQCVDTIPSAYQGELFGNFIGATLIKPGQDTSVGRVGSGSFCDKTVIPEEPGKYIQILYGGRWTLKRPCPTGTIFVQAVCNCRPYTDQTEIHELTRIVHNMTQITICTPVVYLPFTLDEKDQSGNAFQILNHNVSVLDGKSFYHGYWNGLTILQSEILDITNSLVIKVVYSSDHKSILTRPRTIFSNGGPMSGCNESSSVYMYEDRGHITAGIRTLSDSGMAKVVQIQQRPVPRGQQSSKEVMLIFHDGELTLKNGDRLQTIPVEGMFKKVPCPLNIGYRADVDSFKGTIDEFTVYMCQNVLRAV